MEEAVIQHLEARLNALLFNCPTVLVVKPDGCTCIITVSCCNVVKISNKAQDRNREMVLIFFQGLIALQSNPSLPELVRALTCL